MDCSIINLYYFGRLEQIPVEQILVSIITFIQELAYETIYDQARITR